jgi:hypothetical protein
LKRREHRSRAAETGALDELLPAERFARFAREGE